MSDYEKYVLAERRVGAEDMRERAAKYLKGCAAVFNEQDEHPCGRAFEAAAEHVSALPIDPETGGE